MLPHLLPTHGVLEVVVALHIRLNLLSHTLFILKFTSPGGFLLLDLLQNDLVVMHHIGRLDLRLRDLLLS
jgi:hypothetical protein